MSHKKIFTVWASLLIIGVLIIGPNDVFSAALELKQSATKNIMVFMTNVTDHLAGQSNETLDVFISKNGGAFSQSPAMSITDRGDGWYQIALNATDTAFVGPLVFHINASNSDPTDVIYEVVANIESDSIASLVTVQADLDSPNQYKATGFSTHSANDVTGGTTVAQADANLTASISANAITVASISSTLSAIHGADAWITATGFSTISNEPLTAAQVNAEVDNALSDYDGPTRAEATSDKDEIIVQVNANETKIDVIDTNVDTIQAQTDKLIFDGSNSVFATNAISNSPATVDEIADAVWDEAISGHVASGSTGATLNGISVTGISESVWSFGRRELTSITQTRGVNQFMVTVRDGDVVPITRGDVELLEFDLGSDWNLTDKKVYFIAKYSATADNDTAVINRLTNIVNATLGIANIVLTTTETENVLDYDAEIEVRDSDDTNPHTASQFRLSIKQDVRQ